MAVPLQGEEVRARYCIGAETLDGNLIEYNIKKPSKQVHFDNNRDCGAVLSTQCIIAVNDLRFCFYSGRKL